MSQRLRRGLPSKGAASTATAAAAPADQQGLLASAATFTSQDTALLNKTTTTNTNTSAASVSPSAANTSASHVVERLFMSVLSRSDRSLYRRGVPPGADHSAYIPPAPEVTDMAGTPFFGATKSFRGSKKQAKQAPKGRRGSTITAQPRPSSASPAITTATDVELQFRPETSDCSPTQIGQEDVVAQQLNASRATLYEQKTDMNRSGSFKRANQVPLHPYLFGYSAPAASHIRNPVKELVDGRTDDETFIDMLASCTKQAKRVWLRQLLYHHRLWRWQLDVSHSLMRLAASGDIPALLTQCEALVRANCRCRAAMVLLRDGTNRYVFHPFELSRRAPLVAASGGVGVATGALLPGAALRNLCNASSRITPEDSLLLGELSTSPTMLTLPLVPPGSERPLGVLIAIDRLPDNVQPNTSTAAVSQATGEPAPTLLGFTGEDEVMFTLLASAIATALDSHKVAEFRSLQERRLTTLVRTNQAPSLLDVPGLLRATMQRARELLDCESCTILLHDALSNELWSTRNGVQRDFVIVADGETYAGSVALSGQVVNQPKPSADPRRITARAKARSVLCAPIRNPKGMVVGVVEALNPRKRAQFASLDEELLLSFCSDAAVPIERALEFATAVEAQQQAESLLEAVRDVTSLEHELPDLVRRMQRYVGELVGADYCAIALADAGTRELYWPARTAPRQTGATPANVSVAKAKQPQKQAPKDKAQSDEPPTAGENQQDAGNTEPSRVVPTCESGEAPRCSQEGSLLGLAARSGQTLLVAEPAADFRFNPEVDNPDGLTFHNLLFIPVKLTNHHPSDNGAGSASTTGSRVIAVAEVGMLRPDAAEVSSAQLRLLEAFLSHCAVALENCQRFATVRSLRDRLEGLLLMAADSGLHRMQEVEQLMATVMQSACTLLDCESCTLFLVERATEELWTVPAANEPELRLPRGVGLAGRVAASGKMLRIDDPRNDPRFNPQYDIRRSKETRSVLCAPLFDTQGELMGVTQLLNKRGSRPFTELDERLIGALNAQVAAAVTNSGRFQRAVTRARQLEVMLDASVAALRAPTLKQAMLQVEQHGRGVLGAAKCSLFLVDGHDLTYAVSATKPELRLPMVSAGIPGHVASTGVALNVTDAERDPRHNLEMDKYSESKTKALLCVPVISEATGSIIGALQATNPNGMRCFESADALALADFARPVAAIVTRAREGDRLHQEHRQLTAVLHGIPPQVGVVIAVDVRAARVTSGIVSCDPFPILGIRQAVFERHTFSRWFEGWGGNATFVMDMQQVLSPAHNTDSGSASSPPLPPPISGQLVRPKGWHFADGPPVTANTSFSYCAARTADGLVILAITESR